MRITARLCTRTAAVLLVGMVSIRCAESARESVTVADSAGVEIVTNLPGVIEAAERWSLSPEPVVEIGAGASPDVSLFRVTDVQPLEAGRMAVATNTPPRALIFRSDGSLIATLGREGEGPGEFSSVGSVVPLTSDSLAVWDPDRRRISVFSLEGGLGREVDLSGLAPPSARAAPDSRMASGFTHLLPSTRGSLVLFGEGVFGSTSGEGPRRIEMPSHRIASDGRELARFGPFPGMLMGGPGGGVPVPFGPRTHAATAGDLLIVGTADTARYRVFGPEGTLRRIVRWPDEDRTVEGKYFSRWSTMLEEAPAGIRELVGSLQRAERFPAYEGIVATDDGEILVGEYAGPLGLLPVRRADGGPEALRPVMRVPGRRWLVFDPRGVLVATLATPDGFEPYAVRDGLMWGVYSDEVDVESVRAYEVRR